MTFAVRWRSADPERLVERLINALAVQPTSVAVSDAEGPGWAFDFPSGRLSVVRATAGRKPRLELGPRGRRLLGGNACRPICGEEHVAEVPPEWTWPAALGPDLGAVGWATVDIERAAADMRVYPRPLPADELLGAAAALAGPRRGTNSASRARLGTVILIEPRTEGRLAAALARWAGSRLLRRSALRPDWLAIAHRDRAVRAPDPCSRAAPSGGPT